MDQSSDLVGAAQRDPDLRRVVTGLEFLERTRIGSVVLRGVSTETGEQVIVKLRVQEMERQWMTGLFETAPDIVPTVYGSGHLAADVGWIALQQLPHIDPGDPDHARALARAAARFQRVAGEVVGPRFPSKDAAFFERVGRQAMARGLPGADVVVERVGSDFGWIASVAPQVLGHGDLSFSNALRRGSQAVLIDPLPSVAPWPFDAAWCEVGSGGSRTERLVPLLASARSELGLSSVTGPDLHRCEVICRSWASLLAWAMWPRMDDERWVRTTSEHTAALAAL